MNYNITYREKDNGLQVIISYKVDGKWKQKSKQGFSNTRDGKKDAKVAADLMLQDIKLNITHNLDADYENITFKDFTDIFIEHITLYKTLGTIKAYKSSINSFKGLNDIAMRKITTFDLQQCVDTLTKKGLKEISIKGYLAKISTIFNSAIKQYNILAKSPVINIRIKKDKNVLEKTALTVSEFNVLINAFENSTYFRYVPILLIAGTCGLRIGEILGLTWDDVNFTESTLQVNKQWKVIAYKPYKKFGFGDLKSENSYRTVPIPKSTLDYLIKFRNNQPINYINRIVKNNSSDGVITFLNKKLKLLGFHISIHELRHTYATTILSCGMDYKTAAKLLGHNVEQTMKTYSHVTSDMIQRATDLVEKIF